MPDVVVPGLLFLIDSRVLKSGSGADGQSGDQPKLWEHWDAVRVRKMSAR